VRRPFLCGLALGAGVVLGIGVGHFAVPPDCDGQVLEARKSLQQQHDDEEALRTIISPDTSTPAEAGIEPPTETRPWRKTERHQHTVTTGANGAPILE